MAVNKPRNRVLIFRLTQDEYDALQTASAGARSLSDYARTRLLNSPASSKIDQELSEIKTTVARLADLLEKS
ncbi:MAG TPA: hypothetical protein VMB85_06535 [Bryobacteraceae bacterium]|jgi:hypothetical protein|nr:hypothetical protein [Bryobacteraceae bacterium]